MRGGLVDLEFIAQYLQLVHAADASRRARPEHRRRRCGSSPMPVVWRPAEADVLIPAARLINNLTQMLRLCLDGPFDPAKAPDGLKELLARVGEVPDFARLEATLRRDARPRSPRLFDAAGAVADRPATDRQRPAVHAIEGADPGERRDGQGDAMETSSCRRRKHC